MCKKMLVATDLRFHPLRGMRAVRKSDGFTLIEVLVVIAIIGILMSLLFPAVQSALNAAKKAQAKNDVTQIANAIIAFDTEYGRLPGDDGAPQQLTGSLLNALIGKNDTLNPRKIIFLEVQDFKRGKGGIKGGVFVDPWENPYYVALDTDYDNQVGVSSNSGTSADSTITKKAGVWNSNPNKNQRVRSWD